MYIPVYPSLYPNRELADNDLEREKLLTLRYTAVAIKNFYNGQPK
jgi:hypothetical protein